MRCLLTTFLTFVACLTLMHRASGAESGWRSQWQPRHSLYWKNTASGVETTTKNVARLDSRRDDLAEFDLSLRLTRKVEYEPDNHIGIIVRRDGGSWRILFTGVKVVWFFKPDNPASEKEKHGIYKVTKPFVLPVGVAADLKIICRQSGISVSVNGAELGQLRPAPGQGIVTLYTYRLNCELADIVLTPVGKRRASSPIRQAKAPNTGKTTARKPSASATMNLLANPSFELHANADIPDGWTHEPIWGSESDERWFRPGGYDAWHKSWLLQEGGAFEGKRCMKVRHPLELHATVFQMAKGGNYVLSAYLRSDRENFAVFLGASSPGQSRQGGLVRVGRTWKRYSVTFAPYALRPHPYRSICIVPLEPHPGGTLWVDAVQLEQGAEPTPFTPFSPLDNPFKDLKRTLDTGAGGIPEAKIPHPYEGEFKLDGVLDEPMWAAAKEYALRSTGGAPARVKTTIRFAATQKGLVIASRAAFSGPEPMGTRRERDNTALFGDDSIEIFIDPVGEGREYYHFVFNAQGAQFDQKCVTGKSVDRGWNGRWRTAAKAADGVWTAEAFIPFSDLFPGDSFPQGASIRVNVCRNVRPRRELQNWSATYGVFHLPERFGYLFLGDVSGARKAKATAGGPTRPGMEAFFELSYYTTEPKAVLYVKDLAGGRAATATVEVVSPDGKRVFESSAKLAGGEHGAIEIPVQSWAVGRYRARVSCRNAVKELTLVKLPPSKVREVKIDYLRRCIRVDGEPFFPYGPLFVNWAGAEAILFVREAGFNTVWMGSKWNPLEHERRYLKLLDQVGLNLVETRFLHFWKKDAPKRLAGFINNTRSHRCVIARLDIDEPGGEGQPEKAKQILKLAAELNPYVPSYVNHNSWGMFQRYAGLPGPIMSIDRYPIGATPPNEIYTVEKVVEFMEEQAAPRRMPVWIILQSVGHKRNPTAAELNFMTYISIIRGARGISYWAGIPRPRATWERMKGLSREIETLSPVLFSVEPAPQVKIRPEPTVTALVKHLNGATYVIALNRSSSPCNAEIFVDAPARLSKCSVLFESRELAVSGNKISDSFDAFARHVYELK